VHSPASATLVELGLARLPGRHQLSLSAALEQSEGSSSSRRKPNDANRHVTVTLDEVAGRCLVRFPYDPRCVRLIKAVGGGAVARWSSKLPRGGAWSVPTVYTQHVLDAFPGAMIARGGDHCTAVAAAAAASGSVLAGDDDGGGGHTAAGAASASTGASAIGTTTTTTTVACSAATGETERLIAAAELDQPLRNGWTLFPHQKEAVAAILQRRRVILAFDMGLGKTLISLVAARAWQKVGRCCCIE
jgi:hypothetical protein